MTDQPTPPAFCECGNYAAPHPFPGCPTEDGQQRTLEYLNDTFHACPPDGSGLTPCCGRTPFELPPGDRISSETVTCTGSEVCCGCNGAGGPVVYRNFEDNPFCTHCCECDCRTIPCTKPAPADPREQYAVAIERDLEQFFRDHPEEPRNSPWVLGMRDAADAVRRTSAAKDQELEKLRNRLDEYRESRRRWMDAANRDRQAALDADARARKAEAAIEAALTALHDLPYEYAKPILAALDRTEQT